MARTPRRQSKFKDASSEVIAENVLQENPEGLPPVDHNIVEKIVVMKHVPKYKIATFLNGRDPGVALHFHYSSKTHPLKHYTLYHGMEHKLPAEVIDWLESCNEPQYAYAPGQSGHPESFIASRKYIFQFRNVKEAV